MSEWLAVHHGDAPLVVCFPHTGTEIAPDVEARMVSPWRARKDTDFWVDVLYDFAHEMGATTVRTAISRSVIDVNRDPSGASLYPGEFTTSLCPLETFDGEPLYKEGAEPDASEIANRRVAYFDRFHAALAFELERLRANHGCAVLYDAHSIRSRVPRLFAGELPQFNIGTNDGAACDQRLTTAIENVCAASAYTRVTNGRFRGGWITRRCGRPAVNIHAVQMELACRGYLTEPAGVLTPENWPAPFDAAHAAPLRSVLRAVLTTCIEFAASNKS